MRIRFFVSMYLILAASGWAQLRTATVPDEIFYNGKIVTVDPAFSIVEAFAVRDGEILAVGSDTDVRALAGPETRLTDLAGHTVVPGLMDNHNHQHNVALTANWGVQLNNVGSVAEMVGRLRDAAGQTPAGEVVIGAGGWNPRSLAEGRPPTRQDLDQVSSVHPVVVFQGRGTVFANSAALAALGVTRESETLAATVIPKDASGEPTGLLPTPVLVNMVVRTLLPPPPADGLEEWLIDVQQAQHARGLTSIRDLDLSPGAVRAYYKLWEQDQLTMRISMGLEFFAADWEQLEGFLTDWGVGPGFGDHRLRLDSISEFALDSRASALFREPKLDGSPSLIRITPDQIRQAMLTMNRNGWRPSPHIAGDATLDHVLAAYEAADAESPIRGKRWVVEHIPYAHADQMETMARLGVAVSAQLQGRGGTAGAARQLGEERANRVAPIRDLLDHDIVVSTGSDWAGGDNNNPFENIYFYVTRKAADGTLVNPSQRISRQDALRLATINNAYMTFEEDIKGSLEPGKLADFVILSGDVMTVAEERILEIEPLATYVGGRKVYSAPQGGF